MYNVVLHGAPLRLRLDHGNTNRNCGNMKVLSAVIELPRAIVVIVLCITSILAQKMWEKMYR